MMTKTLPAKVAKLDVPRVYRGTAPIYDVWGRLTESKARDRCLELARIRDGEAVLEVAVGTGLAFAEILKQNPSGWIEGIDLTQEMLDKAIRKAAASCQNNYRLCVGDAYHLKFAKCAAKS
jgi:ubiquinone/menaquinone biosynthesis C-methylase UbiE